MKCRQIPKGLSADFRVVFKKQDVGGGAGVRQARLKQSRPGKEGALRPRIQDFLMDIKELFWP